MQPVSPSGYDPREFPPFAVTVDIVVFTILHDALHVLLIERGQDPFEGCMALPGGFVRPDESLDEAAARELEEETGLTKKEAYLEQLRTYGAPYRDPRMRVITSAYWAVCSSLVIPEAGGDAAFALLAPMSEIESGSISLAFDHRDILQDALERLRGKLEYTSVGARFCPPEFTISSLRRAYEAIWETRLDPGNFHRNVQRSPSFKKVRRKPAVVGRKGGRPASLWTAPKVEPLTSAPLARRHKSPMRPARGSD
ncbi:MAG: NUDIX domain-containing protein [Bacteroidota bacterium]|nr:NUDIX domain-containing protein [Bacteroidota bacterium]MDE2835675.1 NUDIX domain-containing protein [Bacteroidota bacterium]MDE2955385.1 NUDIX domain-containing protein [Bacteroidota bacterium]